MSASARQLEIGRAWAASLPPRPRGSRAVAEDFARREELLELEAEKAAEQ